jgi:hypothetical protein
MRVLCELRKPIQAVSLGLDMPLNRGIVVDVELTTFETVCWCVMWFAWSVSCLVTVLGIVALRQ